MMGRTTKSEKESPTKELFFPATDGTAQNQSNAFTGYDVDTDGEDAWIVFHVPSDYAKIVECNLACIGLIADASMTVSVDADYGQPNEVSSQQSQGPIRFTLSNVGLNQIREVDIRQLFIAGDVSGLKAGDYVGVHVERLAIMADDTDLLIIGVNLRYQ